MLMCLWILHLWSLRFPRGKWTRYLCVCLLRTSHTALPLLSKKRLCKLADFYQVDDVFLLGNKAAFEVKFNAPNSTQCASCVRWNNETYSCLGFSGLGLDLDQWFQGIFSSILACAATTGGAGYCAGDTDPRSGPLNIINSNFITNNAQLGGSLYATTGCTANVQGTTFTANSARQYGGAIVTTDFVTLNVQQSNFVSNGAQTSLQPPSGGGALSIGYNQFIVGQSFFLIVWES